MTLDMNGNITTTVHKVCVANHKKDKFISITFNGLKWTDNFNFASCFENEKEAGEFTENTYVVYFM